MGLLDKLGITPDEEPVKEKPKEQPESVLEGVAPTTRQRMGSISAVRAGIDAEINRIIQIPIHHWMDDDAFEEFNDEHILRRHRAGDRKFTFHREQAEAFRSFLLYRRGFLPLSVGRGKSLLSWMMANAAVENKWARHVAIVIPAAMFSEFQNIHLPFARTHVPFSTPAIFLRGQHALGLSKSGRDGIYVISYELISSRKGEEILNNISPDMMIFDEAHKIGGPKSARKRRIEKQIQASNPIVITMSGTMTKKSIADHEHIMKWCLRENTPLPNNYSDLQLFSEYLDSSADVDNTRVRLDWAQPMVDFAQRHTDEKLQPNIIGFRKAYRIRKHVTPGVVSSGDSKIGISLTLRRVGLDAEKVVSYKKVADAIRDVENFMITPSGETIEHAMQTWKWKNELTTGFYNNLFWPEEEVFAKRRRISEATAHDILERSKAQLDANKEYQKGVADWIQRRGRKGLDTPFLVGHSLYVHGAKECGPVLFDLFERRNNIRKSGEWVDRDSEAIWLSDYKIDAAVDWAKALPKSHGAIIWCYHNAVIKRTVEKLREEMGTDRVLPAYAGPEANEALTKIGPRQEHHGKIIVASLASHGTGKNLQCIPHVLYLQWPRPAKEAEQSLGRNHRNGAEEFHDELVTHYFAANQFDHINFAATLNDALYIHQTENSQRLIYCNYDPTPNVYTSAFLQEAGIDKLTNLDEQMQRELFERFNHE